MFGSDKGLQAIIERLTADINALKGKGIIDIIEGDNISIDKKNPRKLKISSTTSVNTTLGGEVTGDISSTILDKSAITSKITETIASSDYVLFGDTSDGNNLKKGLISDIVALVSSGGFATAPTMIYVSKSGNDATGTKGDITKPFLT